MGLILPILRMVGKHPVDIRLLYCMESTGLRMCETFLVTFADLTDWSLVKISVRKPQIFGQGDSRKALFQKPSKISFYILMIFRLSKLSLGREL